MLKYELCRGWKAVAYKAEEMDGGGGSRPVLLGSHCWLTLSLLSASAPASLSAGMLSSHSSPHYACA